MGTHCAMHRNSLGHARELTGSYTGTHWVMQGNSLGLTRELIELTPLGAYRISRGIVRRWLVQSPECDQAHRAHAAYQGLPHAWALDSGHVALWPVRASLMLGPLAVKEQCRQAQIDSGLWTRCFGHATLCAMTAGGAAVVEVLASRMRGSPRLAGQPTCL